MKKLLLILIILFILFILSSFFFPINYFSDKEQDFIVEKGQGAKEISLNLKQDGLIRWPFLFKFYVFILGEESNLKAGKYLFSRSMNIPNIVKDIVSGNSVANEMVVKEGWDIRDIAWYLENQGLFQAEELFELIGFPAQTSDAKDFSRRFSFLDDKPEDISLEGYLFPDTYDISYGDSLENIVIRMLNNFEDKLEQELVEEIESQDKSLFEIITMASLLEKELITFEDKKIASGLLWKRIEIGMPLQVDATVNYVTGKNSRWVATIDTKKDSPYNTYKYKGLPLGPISNPGIESIKAALYPEESPYLYYLSTHERETIFSKTLEEHNIAKAKYLK